MKRAQHVTTNLLAVAVFLCTVQALYWPLIQKPGTEYGWWQINWAAQVGWVLGAPALALAMVSPLAGAAQNVLVVLLALMWTIAFYFLLHIAARWIAGLLRR